MAEAVTNIPVVAYFGYGSLVNPATHRTAIVSAQPARLRGWRRCWRPAAPGVRRGLLSVYRDKATMIDGLLVVDHLDNLPAIDAREAGYRRVELSYDSLECVRRGPNCSVHVYEALQDGNAGGPLQVLQSYLDAVMQGFLRHYGEAGLERLVATTDVSGVEIVHDRADPLYPRAVDLSAAEIALFDRYLAASAIGYADPA